ncbi:MAG: MFS transporter [bacterium]
MQKNQFSLLKSQRFVPLFIVQFLGAFNDNVFKHALVIWLSYQAITYSDLNAEKMISLAAGLFILPFFLFSATAGKLADKYEKSRLIRHIKWVEIVLMIAATVAFYAHSVTGLMIILFGLGTQSSFFGPLKYGILPEHLRKTELISGNAWISSATFLAILLGTLTGGLLILAQNGIGIISSIILTCSIIGYLSSLAIPHTQAQDSRLNISLNIFKETSTILKQAKKDPLIWLCIIGISSFWFLGATLLSQIPIYCKNILNADEQIVILLLVLFSLGIGVGSLSCNRLLKGKINAKFTLLSVLVTSLFGLDLYLVSQQMITSTAPFLFTDLSLSLQQWRVLVDITIVAMAGGVYVVPLYAILQQQAEQTQKARTIAATNIINAIMMTCSALLCMLGYHIKLTVIDLFLGAFVGHAAIGCYVGKKLKKYHKKDSKGVGV